MLNVGKVGCRFACESGAVIAPRGWQASATEELFSGRELLVLLGRLACLDYKVMLARSFFDRSGRSDCGMLPGGCQITRLVTRTKESSRRASVWAMKPEREVKAKVCN